MEPTREEVMQLREDDGSQFDDLLNRDKAILYAAKYCVSIEEAKLKLRKLKLWDFNESNAWDPVKVENLKRSIQRMRVMAEKKREWKELLREKATLKSELDDTEYSDRQYRLTKDVVKQAIGDEKDYYKCIELLAKSDSRISYRQAYGYLRYHADELKIENVKRISKKS